MSLQASTFWDGLPALCITYLNSVDAPKQFVHAGDERLIVVCPTLCATQVHLIQQRKRGFKIELFAQLSPHRSQAFISTDHSEVVHIHGQEQALPNFDFSQSCFNKMSSGFHSRNFPAVGWQYKLHSNWIMLLVAEFGGSLIQTCGNSAEEAWEVPVHLPFVLVYALRLRRLLHQPSLVLCISCPELLLLQCGKLTRLAQ